MLNPPPPSPTILTIKMKFQVSTLSKPIKLSYFQVNIFFLGSWQSEGCLWFVHLILGVLFKHYNNGFITISRNPSNNLIIFIYIL